MTKTATILRTVIEVHPDELRRLAATMVSFADRVAEDWAGAALAGAAAGPATGAAPGSDGADAIRAALGAFLDAGGLALAATAEAYRDAAATIEVAVAAYEAADGHRP